MKLRDYQSKALDSIFKQWDEVSSTLVVMPTGTGKTVLFAGAIERMGGRAMVIAHRQELIWQAREKIQAVTGLRADIEMGEHKASMDHELFHPKAPVVVSTVQTHVAGGDGGGRIGKFDPKDFSLLIIDEAHHAVSPSYRKIIEYYKTNPRLKVLGVTATPDRSDEAALGQVFDSVAFDYEILDAIRDGYLVPIEQQFVSIESLDFSAVRTTAGDLNGVDLSAVMEAEKNLQGIASATIEIIGSRRGIGFASSVNHARMLSEIFNRHKFGMSSFIHGGTDKDERKKIIEDFSRGKFQFIWNCAVFTEGFDDSGVEIISMARPTKSRALYAQMAGRATRPHESVAGKIGNLPAAALRRMMIQRSVKPSCLVVDFVGNSGKHKLMTTADILGGNLSDDVIQESINFTRKSGGPVRMDKQLEEDEEKIEKIKQRRAEEEARRARLVARSTYKTQKIDPFDVLAIKPVSQRGWDDKKVLTEKQRSILRNAGIDPDGIEYARARQLVGIIIDRYTNKKCSLKQAATLERFGYSKEEASGMGFEQASKALDQIAKNGWKRPQVFEAPTPSIIPGGEPVIDSEIPF